MIILKMKSFTERICLIIVNRLQNVPTDSLPTGFFFGKPTHETQIYDSNTYVKEYTYLGIINGQNGEGLYGLEQRNKFSVGETIEVMKPDGRDLSVNVLRICDEEGSDMESCPHPKQRIYVDLGIELSDQDLLRRAEKTDD